MLTQQHKNTSIIVSKYSQVPQTSTLQTCIPMSSASPRIPPLKRWATTASDAQMNAVSGATSGLASAIFTCPLDVIKIRLQAQGSLVPIHTRAANKIHARAHPELYNGLFKTARLIWRGEGLRGMYRGMGPLVMGYLPTWAIWFTAYNRSKSILPQVYRK